MKPRIQAIRPISAVTFFCFCFLSFAHGQGGPRPGDLKINKISHQVLRAPSYNTTGGSLGSQVAAANKPWLHIEVDFESELDWADEVQLKYYVLMGEGRERRLFAGDVTHINVAKSRRNYSAMFMHPSTLARYGRGKVEAVAVQLFYQGRLMDQASNPQASSRWWEQFSPTPGFLLRPTDTPWSVIAHERYEAYKATP
jgi:hypothetical protein